MQEYSLTQITKQTIGRVEATGSHAADMYSIEKLGSYKEFICELLDETLINLRYKDRKENSIKALYEETENIAFDIVKYIVEKLDLGFYETETDNEEDYSYGKQLEGKDDRLVALAFRLKGIADKILNEKWAYNSLIKD